MTTAHSDDPHGLDELIELLKMLLAQTHDYSSSAEATSIAAVATARVFSKELGLTGFQAGWVMWQFVKNWMGYDGQPMTLVRHHDMLYPQYAELFDKTITKETWEYLQTEARALLAKHADNAHGEVYEHWKKIAAGHPPFGYSVKDR